MNNIMSIIPPLSFDQSPSTNNVDSIPFTCTLPLIYNPALTSLSIRSASATNSGIVSTGSQVFAGSKTFANTTDASSTDSGAVIISGGIGIAKNLHIGGDAVCSSVPSNDFHLTNKAYVDRQIHQILTWKQTVLAFRAMNSDPPVTPSDGDRYISTETAGDFVINYIYEYDGLNWVEYTVSEGNAVYSETDNKSYVFSDSGTWSNIGVSIDHNALLNLQEANTGITYGHINDTTQSIYGVKTFANTTNTTTTNSGSVVISGGLGIAKNLIVGGDIYSDISATSQSMTGACTLTASLTCVKIGQTVFIKFPYTTDTATSTTYFSGTGVIPSSFRPSETVRQSIFVLNNNTEVVGSITIDTSGNVYVYNGSSGNFTGVCGFRLNISYII